MLRRSLATLAMLAMLVLLPAAASAGAFTYYGPHLGFSQGPDHMVVGGQLQWNGVAPRLAFVPGIDVGFADATSIATLNGDFHYNLSYDTAWQPYVGAGVALTLWSDRASPAASGPESGGSLILGAAVFNRSGGRFFTELKLGLGDAPDLKVLAGWNLRGR
jgi:hypothetical protein